MYICYLSYLFALTKQNQTYIGFCVYIYIFIKLSFEYKYFYMSFFFDCNIFLNRNFSNNFPHIFFSLCLFSRVWKKKLIDCGMCRTTCANAWYGNGSTRHGNGISRTSNVPNGFTTIQMISCKSRSSANTLSSESKFSGGGGSSSNCRSCSKWTTTTSHNATHLPVK